MRRLWQVALAALACCLAAGTGAEAQSPAQVLEAQLARKPVVRLGSDGARATGRLLALAGGTATLQSADATVSVPLAGVDSIWVRGRATKTGAIVGASVGAIGTAVFVGWLAAGLCEVDCEGAGARGALVGFGLGAVGGGLVGAAIGAAIPKWRLRFP